MGSVEFIHVPDVLSTCGANVGLREAHPEAAVTTHEPSEVGERHFAHADRTLGVLRGGPAFCEPETSDAGLQLLVLHHLSQDVEALIGCRLASAHEVHEVVAHVLPVDVALVSQLHSAIVTDKVEVPDARDS